MPTLTFPSSDVPALPGLTVVAPDDWRAHVVSGALLACRREGGSGFAPNVVVTIARHAPGMTLDDHVAVARSTASSLPSAELDDVFHFRTETSDAAGFDVAYVHPEVGSLVQVMVFVAVDHHGVQDVVHATGSLAAAEVDREYAVVQAALKSLRVQA